MADAILPSHKPCRPVTVFSKVHKIGEGTYGDVYLARDRESSQLVALKRVKLSSSGFDREGMPLTSVREVSLLRRLSHPNIVTLAEVVVGSKADSLFLVFEYCEYELAKLLDSMPTPFSLPEAKCLSEQLLCAVQHLHGCGVLHRDLKMSNLLLNAKGELKLCDFGLAREAPPSGALTPRVVTLWYRAPELLFGAQHYGAPVDLWAVGCVVGELLLHRPLMPGPTEPQQLKLMVELLGAPSDRIWPGMSALPLFRSLGPALPDQPFNELAHTFARLRPTETTLQLLDGLLTYDPTQRLDAAAAAGHAWFRESPRPVSPAALAAARLRGAPARPGQAGTKRRAGRLVGARPPGEQDARRTACGQQMEAEGGEGAEELGARAARLEELGERARARKAAREDGGGGGSGSGGNAVRAATASSLPSEAPPARGTFRIPSPSCVFATSERQL